MVLQFSLFISPLVLVSSTIYNFHSSTTFLSLSIFLSYFPNSKTIHKMATCWPEPIVSVQSLSQTGVPTVPNRYVKPAHQRPVFNTTQSDAGIEIPVLDMNDVWGKPEGLRLVRSACEEWGFFQMVNHGVTHSLMERVRGAWREFFELPLEEKRKYANSPDTYEGYGSRLGVVKDAKLDWSDYFFLNYLPSSIRNPSKWPSQPPKIRYMHINSCNFFVHTYGLGLCIIFLSVNVYKLYL